VKHLRSSGALDPTRDLYVERACDAALLARIRASETCLVLAPRQVGKSSLLIHAQRVLADECHIGRVDLSSLIGGDADLGMWCERFAGAAVKALRIPSRDEAWWRGHRGAFAGGASAALFGAFDARREAAERPVVVMVDELRFLLDLPFRLELLVLLRALRDHLAERNGARVSFVFAGVASLHELIADVSAHPFEARAVSVSDFTLDEALAGFPPALEGSPNERESMARAVYERTSGHPAMTQAALLDASTEAPGDAAERTAAAIDRLYLAHDIKDVGLFKDAELGFSPTAGDGARRRAVERIDLYATVRAAHPEAVAVDVRSPGRGEALKALRIAGVVSMESRGESPRARTRNEVFARVFDARWIERHRARDDVAECTRA